MPPRRRIVEEPTSQLAVWARRLAIFSFPVALLAIIIERAGMLEIVPVLVTFAAALTLAALGILLALGAFVVIWRTGVGGTGHAVNAILIGFVLLAYPTYFAVKGFQLPAIADVTTDPIDPPRFEAIARLRSRDANPIAYAGLYAAELQKAAYPDVEPLMVSVNATVAYEAVIAVVTKRRWRVVDARAPLAGRREGHIEAVARTPIMGFRDDVTIRIRPDGASARIDVRSASRYGRHDFGTNAARVRALLEDIDEATTVDKTEMPARPVQKKAPPAKGNQPAKR